MVPESLLLVCSRWYNIVIPCCTLWSHIDIVISRPQSGAFLKRAKTYVTRAGQTPLDIHIIDPSGSRWSRADWELEGLNKSDTAEDDDCTEEGDFTNITSPDGGSLVGDVKSNDFDSAGPTPVSMTIRSLELLVLYRYYEAHRLALEYYLSRCTPRTLTHLLVRILRPINSHWHLSAPANRLSDMVYIEGSSYTLQGTKGHFDSLATLYLKELYPDWTSQLYCGLVDLRLEGRYVIPEESLVKILRSSPKLRALRLDFRIRRTVDEDCDGAPTDVYLEDLEILNISFLDADDVATILRRLSYGLKPLRLCLPRPYSEAAILNIFKRTHWNVTELRVERWWKGDFSSFLRHFPHIQRLVLGIWDESNILPHTTEFLNPPPDSLNWYQQDTESYSIHLDTLCVARSPIFYHEFRELVNFYSFQRLILWICPLRVSGDAARPTLADIAALRSMVKIVNQDDPNPIEQWI